MLLLLCAHKTDSVPKITHSRPSSQPAETNFQNSWHSVWFLTYPPNWLKKLFRTLALGKTDSKIMNLQIADVDDSFPQPPTVGTDKHIWKARLKLPFHKACLFSLQYSASPGLCLPHAHTEVQVWSNSCSRKTSHSLNIARCREGVKTLLEVVTLILHPKGQKLPR